MIEPTRQRPPAGLGHDATLPLRLEEDGLLACVHCGFCLSSCPTYTRLGHEGDSPRGRLDLMRAVMEGRLPPEDPGFRQHIDQCLGCRACEPVCPSGVPYGFLLERARAAIARSTGVSWSTRMLIAGFTGPLSPIVGAASRLFRATQLPKLLVRILPRRAASIRFALAMLASSAASPILRRGSALRGAESRPITPSAPTTRGPEPSGSSAPAPSTSRPIAPAATTSADVPGSQTDEVATGSERALADPHARMGAFPASTSAPGHAADAAGRVAILTGCVQDSLFGRVNRATRTVLAANGCPVTEVPGQRCCGALDAHAGRLERAADLARTNIAAFEDAGVDHIVVNAAGCGAMMKEYGEQLRHDAEWAERAHRFSQKVEDAAEFLARRGVRPGAPVPVSVAYDAPCHLHHGQRIREAPLRLLDSVPGLVRVPLRDAEECCGGAGLYGVHHPELGGRILSDKVAAVIESGAEAVVTPNPGCMMQIGAGLLLDGRSTAVLHPLEILAEGYRREKES